MHFRSYDGMVVLVRSKGSGLPAGLGLMVYVPRSRIIPATQIEFHFPAPVFASDPVSQACR